MQNGVSKTCLTNTITFQQDLLKRDEALVKNFDFPPKKSVGNRAGKVVEDRRKRLQGGEKNINYSSSIAIYQIFVK